MINKKCIYALLILLVAVCAIEKAIAQETFSIVKRTSAGNTVGVYLKLADNYSLINRGVSLSGNRITVRTSKSAASPIPANSDVLLGAFPTGGEYEVEVLTGPELSVPTSSLGVKRFAIGAMDLAQLPAATTPTYGYTDLWWNPGESGWGMNITMKQNTFFAVWYVYDQTGAATWYTLQQGKWINSSCYSGDVIKTNGPVSGGIAPPPLLNLNVSIAGDATICFADYNTADFTYRLLGIGSNVKTIVRQSF